MEVYEGFDDQMDYIASTAIEYVPVEKWTKIRLTFKDINLVTEFTSKYWVNDVEEEFEYFEPDEYLEEDYEISPVFDDMKLALGDTLPGHGSFFSVTIDITPDEVYKYSFDYENLPEYEFENEELNDADFVKEYEYYPRIRKNIPEWWLKILERNKVEIMAETA
jgi:hypothetical protein